MRRAVPLGVALTLAACNSAPPKPPEPRVPRIAYADFVKDPGAFKRFWPTCLSLNASGTMTKPESNNCLLLKANANLYASDQKLKADARAWHGF